MRKAFTTTLVIVFTFFTFCFDLNSMVFGNDGNRGYEGGGGDNPGESPLDKGNNQIKVLIIQGAVQFIKAQSEFQGFLQKVEQSELSGVNFEELQDVLNSTIHIMEGARNTYFDLKTLAGCTPYNEIFINKLKIFDYNAFQENNGLIQETFKKVESFLKKGDITGTYIKIHADTVEILELLYKIKHSIDASIFPEIKDLWELNQKYLNSLCFGQYIAQVFYKIKNRRIQL